MSIGSRRGEEIIERQTEETLVEAEDRKEKIIKRRKREKMKRRIEIPRRKKKRIRRIRKIRDR